MIIPRKGDPDARRCCLRRGRHTVTCPLLPAYRTSDCQTSWHLTHCSLPGRGVQPGELATKSLSRHVSRLPPLVSRPPPFERSAERFSDRRALGASFVVMPTQIAVTRGRFQPTSVRFAPEGAIYLIDRKAKSKGKDAKDTGRKAKMKIGTFRVDMKTLPPIIDRAFTSFNR